MASLVSPGAAYANNSNNSLGSDVVQKYALIIGISDYPASPITGIDGSVFEGGLDLYYADDDAQTVQSALLTAGFETNNITVLTDSQATEQNILKSIKDIANKATDNDEVVLYFSGHSVIPEADFPDPVAGLWPRYAPNNSDVGMLVWGENRKPTVIFDTQLAKALENIAANAMLISFDACWSGRFEEVAGPGRIVVSATDSEATAIAGEFGPVYAEVFGVDPDMLPPGGLFTTFFVTMGMGLGFGDYPPIGNMDGVATVEEAFYFAQGMLTEMSNEFADFGLNEVPVIIDNFPGDMEL